MKGRFFIILAVIVILTCAIAFSADIVNDTTAGPEAFTNYIGLGAYFITAQNGLEVSLILKGSPAEGKLELGDILTKVNNFFITQAEGQQALASVENKEGTTVTLTILRKGQTIEIPISSAKVIFIPPNVAKSIVPAGKIIGFQTEKFFTSNLSQAERIRTGDVFCIFEGDKLLGVARVRQVGTGNSEMNIIRYFGRIATRKQSEYTLIHYGYLPITYIQRPSPTPAGDGGKGK